MNPLNWWLDRRRFARALFVLWALLVFALTHWPGLAIEGAPIQRPDLIAHLGVFGVWGTLFGWCQFFGPATSGRNAVISLVVGISYAAFDEATQAIPALHRHARWDDWLANIAGLTLGVGLAWALARATDRSDLGGRSGR